MRSVSRVPETRSKSSFISCSRYQTHIVVTALTALTFLWTRSAHVAYFITGALATNITGERPGYFPGFPRKLLSLTTRKNTNSAKCLKNLLRLLDLSPPPPPFAISTHQPYHLTVPPTWTAVSKLKSRSIERRHSACPQRIQPASLSSWHIS